MTIKWCNKNIWEFYRDSQITYLWTAFVVNNELNLPIWLPSTYLPMCMIRMYTHIKTSVKITVKINLVYTKFAQLPVEFVFLATWYKVQYKPQSARTPVASSSIRKKALWKVSILRLPNVWNFVTKIWPTSALATTV